MNKDYNNHMLFAEKILSDFIDNITGRNKTKIIGENPDESFFVGKLSSIDDVIENKDMNSNVKVNQMSIDFFIKKEEYSDSKLNIKIRGELYYRILPTYDEQREFYLKELNKKTNEMDFNEISEAISYFEDNRNNRQIMNLSKCSLLPIYNKLAIDDNLELKVDLKSLVKEVKNQGVTHLNQSWKNILIAKSTRS